MSVLAARTSSPSPSRTSFGSKFSALGAKLGLSSVRHDAEHEEEDSVSPILLHNGERSLSRGREAFQSTGRGGIGNFRQTSRDARPETGPDDFSPTRGREPVSNPNQVFSTGRGGAGNIRSPSREPSKPAPVDSLEQDVIRDYVVAHENSPRSSGRGGLGNIDRSRSRDPTGTAKVVHSTGRGGAGNILYGSGAAADSIDEDERRKFSTTHDGLHSTGRGGAANITSSVSPAIEHPAHIHAPYESTGRGGVGNIIRDDDRARSSSRTRT